VIVLVFQRFIIEKACYFKTKWYHNGAKWYHTGAKWYHTGAKWYHNGV